MAERTFHFTNERISYERNSSQNLADGRHVMKVSPGRTKILANIVKGKITAVLRKWQRCSKLDGILRTERNRFHAYLHPVQMASLPS